MAKSKNIIIIIWSLEIGGAERQAIFLAKKLKVDYNYNVTIIGLAFKGTAIPYLDMIGIPWIFFPYSITNNKKLNFINLLKAIWLIRKIKPFVILSFTYLPNILGGNIWKYCGVSKFIWCQRDIGRNFNGSKLEQRAIKNTKIFTVNSNEGKNFLINSLNIVTNNIHIIKNGIELLPPLFNSEQWRQKLNINNNSIIILKIANITDAKDHIIVIKAWNELIIRGFKNIHLLFAGRFGNKYNESKKLIEKYKIQDSTHLLGFIEDVTGLLQVCDISVYSSNLEGSPNGVLECMAYGLPVIASNIIAIHEILGVNYEYLFDPGDFITLANLLSEFIRNTNLRKKEGLKNKKIIEERFNGDLMVSSYHELFN